MDEAGKSPTPSQPQPAAPAGVLSIDDFKKLQLRVGIVTAAQDHPNADRLLILSVDIGEPTPRQLVAGIRGSYQAADLIGKHVVVVANLKPAMLRGVESQGMVLAASDGSAIVVVVPDRPIAAGSLVK